jgi:5'-nucleotidase
MRRVACWFAVGLVMSGGAVAQDIHLKIIALNDFHGNLESPGSFRANAQSPEVPVGGAEFMAGYIAHLKSENPLNVVVSSGDLTGGSPLISALFHDEDTVEAANLMGLEINGVGNHEFDQGKRELLRKQFGGCWKKNPGDSCGDGAGESSKVFRGAKFEYLAANVYDTSTGKTIFPGYAIRTYAGVKVAFIGLTLKDTPTISTPSGVAGLRFADEADTIHAIVQRLRREGIGIFVVLIHQGGFQKGGGVADINGCAGGLAGTPIQSIVNKLDDGVVLVLSAHTHQPYVCSIPNRAGRGITVTSASAYGRVVTDVDLTISGKTKKVTNVSARNVLVDRTNPAIQPDAAVEALVDGYRARAAPLANRVVGSIGAEITKAESASGESKMGDLIADAQLEATHAAADGGAMIAFTNQGGIRTGLSFASGTPSAEAGKVTYGELFAAQPFGNDLVTMTLTGAQIKMVLEEQFKGCGAGETAGDKDAPDTQRVLQVSAGFSYLWDANGKDCAKVSPNSIQLNGAMVDPAAKYRVTMNSLLADGGEQFPVLKQGTDRRTGVRDLDAMEMYFAKHASVVPSREPRVLQEP